MRALKTILIIIVALIALLVVLGLFVGPRTTVVQRSTVVNATPAVIYPKIANLRTMHSWSPWKDMEKGQENRWEGEEGTVGSVHHWVGDTVGTGSQRIITMEQDRSVDTELKFIEPWEATSQVRLELAGSDSATTVTWTMTQENDLMGRIMTVFMDMDGMIGPDFEKGLSNLKQIAEAEQTAIDADLDARTFGGYLIDQLERPATVFMGKRAKMKWSEMDGFFNGAYPGLASTITQAGETIAGDPSAIYFLWDEKNMSTDVMAGFPVSATGDVRVPGLVTHAIPACKVLQTTHRGSPETSEAAHRAISEMIAAKGLTHYGNVIEEYVVGQQNEPDMNNWVTNIQYMIE